MIKVSLRDFICSCRFGPIRFGMAREEVEGILGPPDGDLCISSADQQSGVSGSRYGAWEFVFNIPPGVGMGLSAIRAELDSEGFGACHVFQIDPWIVRRQMTLTELEAGLTDLGVKYWVLPDWIPEEPEKDVLVESGVSFEYVTEPSGVGGLVGLFSIEAAAPWMREVRVTLPPLAYHMLHEAVKGRGMAMDELCCQWIVERALGKGVGEEVSG